MKPNEIKDEKTLLRWLSSRPSESRYQDSMIIAHRSICRMLPIYLAGLDGRAGRRRDWSFWQICRSMWICGVAIGEPTPEVRRAAAAIREVAFSNVNETNFLLAAGAAAIVGAASSDSSHKAVAAAARATGDAADAAGNYAKAARHFWEQVRYDSQVLANGGKPLTLPLWSIPLPDWFRQADGEVRADLEKAPESWDFWLRWWEGLLSGEQLDWALQRDIALIPADDWDRGPSHVAKLIGDIELAYIVAATPNSEDILRGPDGLFYASLRTSIRRDLFRDAKEKVAETLAEIRALPRNNLIGYLSSHLARIEKVLADHADKPQRVHDEFEQSGRAIERMLKAENLPADALTERLLNQLDQGEIDIRRSDKEVAATVKARASSRLHRLKAEQKSAFDGAMRQAAKESRSDLKREIHEDIVASNDPTTTEEKKDEPAYRLVSRGARMAKSAKDGLIKSADDATKLAKGAEVAGKITENATHWWDVITNAISGLFS